MDKWADYGISDVRFNAAGTHIDQVRARPDNGNTIGDYTTLSRTDVISNLRIGLTYVTILKGSDGNWRRGSDVYRVTVDGADYIKTKQDNSKADNLDNLPTF